MGRQVRMKKFRSFILVLISICVFSSTLTVTEAVASNKLIRSGVQQNSLIASKNRSNKRAGWQLKRLSAQTCEVELTVFKPDDQNEQANFNLVAVNEEGKEFNFDSKDNEYEKFMKSAKLPYGKYTLKVKNPEYFVYSPEIEAKGSLLSKDLYAYKKAALKIVAHGYEGREPKYSIYLNELDSSWTYKRLSFRPELVPQAKGVKVEVKDYDSDNYIVKEKVKSVDIKTNSAVVGFNFIKKQSIAKVSAFDKVKVPANFSKSKVIERLPAKGELTLEDGTKREVALSWSIAEFVDNKEDTVTFTGKYPEQKDLKNVMEFRIEVERLGENSSEVLIESIDPIKPVEVKFGTTKEELGKLLPKTIRVKLTNSKDIKEVPVEWEITDYNPEKPGSYSFNGKYSIDGVQDYLVIKAEIVVKEKEIPLGEDDFTFTKKNGRVILKDIKKSGKEKVNKSKQLVVPASFNGEPLVEIGDAACQWSDFEHLEIPNTVEVLDRKAFGYGRLTSLVIPDSVKQIGVSAFTARPKVKEPRIKEVKMSANVEKIDDAAFGWAGFTEIEVPTTLKELHKEAFYKANGHPETKKVHVYVKGYVNPNGLKDGITHIINPAKVAFEYRYKGKVIKTTEASYKLGDKYFHINEETVVKPDNLPSGYETATTEISVIPNAKEYVQVVNLIKPEDKVVAKEVIHQFKDINVPFGTDKEALKQKLPTTVTIVDNKEDKHIVPVKWYLGSYDGSKPSVYKIRASFSLPEGVVQNTKEPVALEYWLKVTVNKEDTERSIDIEFTFPGSVGVPELYAVDEMGKEYILKHSGASDWYSVKAPKGKYTVRVRNIAEGFVSVPSYLSVNTTVKNATGVMSLEKGVQLKVKAVDEKGSEIPNVVIKTMVPILDVLTYKTAEYEYSTLIPSSLEETDEIKVFIKEVPDGYRVIGEKRQTISFSKTNEEIVFKLQKIADLIDISQDGRFVHIKIRQNAKGGNFIIRDSGDHLVYVGVPEKKNRSISLYLEDEDASEYTIYINVEGVVRKKSISLQ